ncbi:Phospho-2-dehydro-3-deoxyheptonate aldolase, Phe-sensitive [Candidatus Arsenophonus lipoptenae]|uniref:Phospho-2-dehydro-3-deoxyheptonate aldolase n=1 Tax=Candidatus Arsenophonus lipoptenae TaxID=634113 RepID=A0A109QEN5_9GAMM|nr:3-deoxy-7-phosphoheptulonate synthase [Candidatus Arsenophonus lipoptenae]AMA65126.1 Phospho-2-dehydro-3-deoxyheptonate aldolase, Phe-sensitive [Candidatus Arsenophonus lipoptenae]
MYKIDELRTRHIDKLITPQDLVDEFPLSNKIVENVVMSRKAIELILIGQDQRLLVVIGPCSVHDTKAAFEYAQLLSKLRVEYKDYLEIVMRTHFEKPRTVIGWKGLILDPDLNNSYKVNKGLRLARELLMNINQLQLPTATEFLDMITGRYVADLISWGAIGARTTESQIHRQMASALSCPIGFKNSTDGNINIAINAILAARTSHVFLSPDKNGQMTIYQTQGNPYGHIIMRGGKNPNYKAKDIAIACYQLRQLELPEQLMIDCSHGNCQKDYHRQIDVAKNIAGQLERGSKVIAGIMAESFLVEGAQKVISGKELTYGQSITDPCLGWQDTEKLLAILAEAVKYRF